MNPLQRINASLAAARRKTRIELTSGGGYLRIRFSEGGKLKRISPHIPNTIEGLHEIERLAILIDSQLALGKLDSTEWSPRSKKTSVLTNAAVIARARLWYFRNREETEASLFCWRNDYFNCAYRKLNPEAEFRGEPLLEIISSYPAGSRQRIRVGSAFSRLAKEAKDYELARAISEASRPVRGAQSGIQRFIPSDDQIQRFVDGLDDDWQWVIGVISCFGLRPHEVCHSTPTDDPRLLRVGPKTKTGARIALARKPEWIDRWSLSRRRLPLALMLQDRPNTVIGSVICKFLKSANAGFQGYSLRHRYSIAMISSGVKIDIIARSMGHSVSMSYAIYQRFIDEHELGAIARSIT